MQTLRLLLATGWSGPGAATPSPPPHGGGASCSHHKGAAEGHRSRWLMAGGVCVQVGTDGPGFSCVAGRSPDTAKVPCSGVVPPDPHCDFGAPTPGLCVRGTPSGMPSCPHSCVTWVAGSPVGSTVGVAATPRYASSGQGARHCSGTWRPPSHPLTHLASEEGLAPSSLGVGWACALCLQGDQAAAGCWASWALSGLQVVPAHMLPVLWPSVQLGGHCVGDASLACLPSSPVRLLQNWTRCRQWRGR